ncbi:MAG TPA: cobalamin-binding protein [Thermoanaerobaculia bacterium]|jgi:iron complex transport system substrate-binding protein|nr:cobalamin-binding protein [Thermoanaerobaculia bacterium]
MRIVSLLPSATEIVCALGYESMLVGRSHECDFPAGIERLPVLTESKIHGARTTHEIHARIGSVLEHDVSVYRVDADLLRDLAPTHIVTQVQCDVCAVSLRDVEAAIADWSGMTAPKIVPLNPGSLDDVFADVARTAAALHDAERGAALVEHMRREMASIAAVASEADDKPRVAMIEWLAPLMTAGNWAPELVALAGGINLLGEAGKHSPWIEWDALVDADPDVIVILPCGFGIPEIECDLHLLTEHPAWPTLRAVERGDVFLADGNQYFNRPGPRLVESLQILAEIVHPDRFHFGFEGQGWKRWRD